MQTGAAYIRVSTEEQMEFSPDSQLKKIREYTKCHGIVLPEELVFVDEGISGRHAEKRPAFMKMIGAAKVRPKPFDMILVWKFSRFARNRQDSILYKSMLRKECGIDVVSVSEQLSDDPTAILIEAMLEAMDEYYSINLAQEVKRGMNEKFSRGGVVSAPPFGYRMGTEHFEVDGEKAGIVRMIYEAFLNGASYREIAVRLNTMGVRSNRGNPFENRTVEYILSNPVYLGKQRRNLKGIDKNDRFHCGEQVLVVDAGHSPIISGETFYAAGERIAKLKKSYPKHARTSQADFMLRGLVRCKSCGSTLTQMAKGKALQCHKYAKGQCSKSHYVLLDKLNAAVLAKLAKDWEEEAVEICIANRKSNAASEVSKALLEKECKWLEKAKAAYMHGVDSLEEYKTNKDDIEKRIRMLEKNQKKSAHTGEEITENFCGQLKKIIPGLKSADISENEKNRLLRLFVNKIVFDRADGSIEIYYYV